MTRGDGWRRDRVIFSRTLLALGAVALVGLTGLVTTAGADRSEPAHRFLRPHATRETDLTSYKGPWGQQLVVKVGGQKLSLFIFSKDSPGKSACYGKCQKTWYPLLAHGRIAARGKEIRRHQLKTFRRRNGARQIEYYGRPLYRCYRNTKTGQNDGTNDYAFGGSWGLASAGGSEVAPEYGPPPPPNCSKPKRPSP